MVLNDLLTTTPSWSNADGKYSEIVLSSSVRLARNLGKFKFTWRAKKDELESIFNLVSDSVSSLGTDKLVIHLSELSHIERKFLVERSLVTPDFIRNGTGKGLVIWKDETLSLMINGEDHLSSQSLAPGLNLKSAYNKLDRLDNELSSTLSYAFSPKIGYLTASPTNVGTGLRASVLIHLPGLVHSGKIKKLLDKLMQLGFLIHGFYGKGTSVEGNFFKLSNRATLGRREEELVDSLYKIALQVIEYENDARELLLKNVRLQLEDKIWRAWAILKLARLLSFEEFVNLSSAVRLGIGLGILRRTTLHTLNELLLFVQPAHLQLITKGPMASGKQDVMRALYVRQKL